jgi:HlyD family secretion protein
MTVKKGNGGRRLAIGAVALIALVWAAMALGGSDDQDLALIEGAPVMRGPLRISVVERGNLKAAESVTLKSEIEGQTTVLWLIEEGTEVQPGDLLCELDTADLVDRRVQQEIRVQNVEATLVKARQSHAIQESQNQSDIARAERELEFARIDLEKYLEGDMPQELKTLDEDILVANQELSQAEQDLEWSEKLAERGFLEQAQLEADRLDKTRYEVKVSKAQRAKELYESYEIPRKRKELEAEVEEKQRELERVKLQATARIADFEANVRTSEATFELEQGDLEKIVTQIDKGTLRAPRAGMVVFAMEDRGRWSSGEPMQEGASVRERQDIITIPSSEGYIAEASLHESVLEKVEVGMPCLVTVDALKENFPARVAFKAVLPDQGSWWANPNLRVYRTTIEVLAQDPRMRPGMSCSIEILVDELDDVLYVPVQAVFLDAGLPVCFVSSNGRAEKRSVEIGPSNSKWVEIQSGLEEGEKVLLARPAGMTLAPAPEKNGEEERESWEGARMGGKPPGALNDGSRGQAEGKPAGAEQGAGGSGGGEPGTGGGGEGRPARPSSGG